MMPGTLLSGGQLLALLIVIIVIGGQLYKQKLKSSEKSQQQRDDETTKTMREQIDRLEQRVQVLERIVTDQGYEVSRAIDALADKPSSRT